MLRGRHGGAGELLRGPDRAPGARAGAARAVRPVPDGGRHRALERLVRADPDLAALGSPCRPLRRENRPRRAGSSASGVLVTAAGWAPLVRDARPPPVRCGRHGRERQLRERSGGHALVPCLGSEVSRSACGRPRFRLGGALAALVLPHLGVRSGLLFLAGLCLLGIAGSSPSARRTSGKFRSRRSSGRCETASCGSSPSGAALPGRPGRGYRLRRYFLHNDAVDAAAAGVLAAIQIAAAALRIGAGRWSDVLGSRGLSRCGASASPPLLTTGAVAVAHRLAPLDLSFQPLVRFRGGLGDVVERALLHLSRRARRGRSERRSRSAFSSRCSRASELPLPLSLPHSSRPRRGGPASRLPRSARLGGSSSSAVLPNSYEVQAFLNRRYISA